MLPPDYQQPFLDRARDAVNLAVDNGEEVFFVDECTFSPKTYKPGMWAPVGDPIVFQRRWEPQRYVAVMGAASLESGLFYWESTYGAAMKADQTKQFLRNLKGQTHKPRIVVFWDNAGIHRAAAVRLYAIELGIRLIMNAPLD